jgi:hypothetical protein
MIFRKIICQRPVRSPPEKSRDAKPSSEAKEIPSRWTAFSPRTEAGSTRRQPISIACACHDGGGKRLHFHGVSEEVKGVITGGLLVVSDHRIDTGSKSFHGEGFDHYLHAEFDLDTPERGVLGVAGNKQHFQPG